MQNNKKRRLSLNGRLFLSLIAVKDILMVDKKSMRVKLFDM